MDQTFPLKKLKVKKGFTYTIALYLIYWSKYLLFQNIWFFLTGAGNIWTLRTGKFQSWYGNLSLGAILKAWVGLVLTKTSTGWLTSRIFQGYFFVLSPVDKLTSCLVGDTVLCWPWPVICFLICRKVSASSSSEAPSARCCPVRPCL